MVLLRPTAVHLSLSKRDLAAALGRRLLPEEKEPYIKMEWERCKTLWQAEGTPFPNDPGEADPGAWKSLDELLFRRVYAIGADAI